MLNTCISETIKHIIFIDAIDILVSHRDAEFSVVISSSFISGVR